MRNIVTIIAFLIGNFLAAADDLSLQVLAEMNLARTAPQEYARLLEARGGDHQGRTRAEALRFLRKTTSLPPLEFSSGLSHAALSHVLTQGPRGGRGHGNFSGRIDQFGKRGGTAGENVHYGTRDARGIVMALIVDEGVPSRGHRKNIFSRSFATVGVACGSHSQFGAMCVMDFASSFTERDQLAAIGRRTAAF